MKLNSFILSPLRNKISLLIVIICLLSVLTKIRADNCDEELDNNLVPIEDLEEKIPVADTNSTSIKSYKFLFMYKYHGVQNEPEHKLNLFTYKNILLSNDQIVFFESPNENDPIPDEAYDTTKYLFTVRYDVLDLPCLYSASLCSYSEFVKEFKPMFPEIDYTMPSEVLEKMMDPAKISTQCLNIFLGPPSSLGEAMWICSEDLKAILDFQEKISSIIRFNNNASYDFVADYIRNGQEQINGIVSVDKEKLNFSDMSHKLLLSVEFKDLELYASTLYLKEDIEWKGEPSKKPDPARCMKLLQTSQVANKNPDIFCVFFQRSDITMKMTLNTFQARMAAELYANKINIRMQMVHKDLTLSNLATLNPKKLEIDAKILFTLKIQIRMDYFRVRRHYINQVRVGILTKTIFASKLEVLKKKIVIRVCNDMDICKRAMLYCIDKGYLSLRGKRERFAWDLMNPYHRLMGKINIRISLPPEDSRGKRILNVVTKIKKTYDYYAEKVSETAIGQIPNFYTIRKAYNTIIIMRDVNKVYKRFDELTQFCKADVKSASNNIKRKISFLSYAGDNDIFFEYLGFIRDFQFTKKD